MNIICEIPICNKPTKNAGMCWGHYYRKRRNSNLNVKIRGKKKFDKYYLYKNNNSLYLKRKLEVLNDS